MSKYRVRIEFTSEAYTYTDAENATDAQEQVARWITEWMRNPDSLPLVHTEPVFVDVVATGAELTTQRGRGDE